jgi:Uma2 family endonuclease
MADLVTTQEIGPENHGDRMSLAEFAGVSGRPGCIYELERGVIVVVDVPGVPHMMVVQVLRNALVAYQLRNPALVPAIASGADCALRMPQLQSERHPDLAVYLTPPPRDDPQPWEYWTPDIVVEVVSKGGEQRDYGVKRDEYLQAGVKLYWIIDPANRSATVLTRHADTWRETRLAADASLTTPLLPGLSIELATVFAALR